MNRMVYKGYTAAIQYDERDDCFVGRVIGITDRIVFDGESTTGLRRNFHEVLNTYLVHCQAIGKPPETPRSGKVLLRLPAELHAYVTRQAEATGESVNGIIVGAVERLKKRERRDAARRDAAKDRTRPRGTRAGVAG
jgi:predicted HicB family RNase H-like nuclease